MITGHDRDEIGALRVPQRGREAICDAAGAARSRLRPRRCEASREPKAAARRIPRALLVLSEPPSIDAGEITDKGYINQRAVLERRAALVEQLYAGVKGVVA